MVLHVTLCGHDTTHLRETCTTAAGAQPRPLHTLLPTRPAAQVPVVFFSLLRKGTPDRDRSEAKLAEAFDYVSCV